MASRIPSSNHWRWCFLWIVIILVEQILMTSSATSSCLLTMNSKFTFAISVYLFEGIAEISLRMVARWLGRFFFCVVVVGWAWLEQRIVTLIIVHYGRLSRCSSLLRRTKQNGRNQDEWSHTHIDYSNSCLPYLSRSRQSLQVNSFSSFKRLARLARILRIVCVCVHIQFERPEQQQIKYHESRDAQTVQNDSVLAGLREGKRVRDMIVSTITAIVVPWIRTIVECRSLGTLIPNQSIDRIEYWKRKHREWPNCEYDNVLGQTRSTANMNGEKQWPPSKS